MIAKYDRMGMEKLVVDLPLILVVHFLLIHDEDSDYDFCLTSDLVALQPQARPRKPWTLVPRSLVL